MGWAPTLNFKLRDDEFMLGKLVIGKEIIPDLEKLIIGLRNGAQINSSFYQQLFNGFVFIDEEFKEVKEDFEHVKIDYKYFRDVFKSKMRFDFSGMLAHAETVVNYAVGSSTWLEKYGQMKHQAGEMYKRLKALGVDFGDKAAEYEKRYAHVPEPSATNSAIVDALQEQYKQDIINGVPDAAERYLSAAKALGPVEAARAESQIRLLNASAIAGKGEVVSKAGTGELIDGTDVEDNIPESTHGKMIDITTDVVLKKIDDIYGTGNTKAILEGLKQVNQFVEEWCKDVGIMFPSNSAISVSGCSSSATIDEIRQKEKSIVDMLMFSANKSLFDTDPRSMSEEEWEAFADVQIDEDDDDYSDEPNLRYDRAVGTGGVSCTVENLIKTLDDIKLIKDLRHRARCAGSLVYDIGHHVLPKAGFDNEIAQKADQIYADDCAGRLTPEQVISECDEIMKYISTPDVRDAINANPYYKSMGFVTE